jgi:nucleotide-binding universal stress UspA family protein
MVMACGDFDRSGTNSRRRFQQQERVMDDVVQDRAAADRLALAKQAFRSIIVHVQDDPATRLRLEAAAALAGDLDATLIGVGAEMIQASLFADPLGMSDPMWVEEAVRLTQDNLDRAEKAFHAATDGVDTDWLRMNAFPVEAVIAASRAADLVVAGGGRPALRDGYRWCDPAELAIKSGRPVLIVPEQGGPMKASKVLVAWKDTREARRAVADAIPFLKAADEVVVLEVSDHDAASEAQMHTFAVVKNLKRHGVKARAKTVIALPIQTGEVLIRQAEELGADLVVSGAYGHSRLGEWAFGGVTADLLKWKARYCLVSH